MLELFHMDTFMFMKIEPILQFLQVPVSKDFKYKSIQHLITFSGPRFVLLYGVLDES